LPQVDDAANPDLFTAAIRALRMERYWKQAGATGGNWSQMGSARKRLRQAKTVATGCDRLPIGAHGKEGVDGSSPSEGFAISVQISCFWLHWRRSITVSTSTERPPSFANVE
jgi:hypothetical protein